MSKKILIVLVAVSMMSAIILFLSLDSTQTQIESTPTVDGSDETATPIWENQNLACETECTESVLRTCYPGTFARLETEQGILDKQNTAFHAALERTPVDISKVLPDIQIIFPAPSGKSGLMFITEEQRYSENNWRTSKLRPYHTWTAPFPGRCHAVIPIRWERIALNNSVEQFLDVFFTWFIYHESPRSREFWISHIEKPSFIQWKDWPSIAAALRALMINEAQVETIGKITIDLLRVHKAALNGRNGVAMREWFTELWASSEHALHQDLKEATALAAKMEELRASTKARFDDFMHHSRSGRLRARTLEEDKNLDALIMDQRRVHDHSRYQESLDGILLERRISGGDQILVLYQVYIVLAAHDLGMSQSSVWARHAKEELRRVKLTSMQDYLTALQGIP